jgi:hypothetical protein
MGDEYYELWGRVAYAPGFGLACHPGRGSAQQRTAACGNTRLRHVITLHTVVIEGIDALGNLFKIVIQLCRKIVNGHAATIPSHVFLIVANTVK